MDKSSVITGSWIKKNISAEIVEDEFEDPSDKSHNKVHHVNRKCAQIKHISVGINSKDTSSLRSNFNLTNILKTSIHESNG